MKQYNEHKQNNNKVGGIIIHEDQKDTTRSFLEKSYLDESEHASLDHFNLERLSSIKKQRKRNELMRDMDMRRDLIDFHRMGSEASISEDSEVSPIKGIYRSNSELYLKNLEMQDESDNLFIEINPIIYAQESSPSMPQST